MRKLLLMLALFGCINLSPVIAQSVSTPTQEQAASQLKVLVKQLQTYQADFAQKVTDAEGEVLQEASGNLALMQPGKLSWRVLEPDENTLIADGKTLWQVDPFMQQVIAMQQKKAIADNPFILLTDPDTTLWQQYRISQSGKTRVRKTYVIEALSDQSPIVSLSLTFEKQRLVKLVFNDRQEQTSTFAFSNIRQNKPIAAERFVFTLPEGFELDDQRK